MPSRFSWALVTALALASASRSSFPYRQHISDRDGPGPRILTVVAHPDDEISFAGTLYKTSHFLAGRCDVAVITNGEGGFKYATLAESLYGCELTLEDVGRSELPAIRKRELRSGCELLGVRDLYFFDQKDHRYTTDLGEVLGPGAGVWDLERVRAGLRALLHRGDYDFVFTLAPTATTHAHHQAATFLALEAAWSLPPGDRPVVLCSQPRAGDPVPASASLEGLPSSRTRDPGLVFDLTRKFGHRERLDYRIVVNWAIAEHKSQGTMQLLMNRGEQERFLLFEGNNEDAEERARTLFRQLERDPFTRREYGSSAGTNAAAR